MKKSILIAIGILLVAFQNFAQSPFGFNYQAALRNSLGEPATNTDLTIRISLHAETFDGIVSYQEEHESVTTSLGLVNLTIGQGDVISGVFEDINWNGYTAHFIQVEIDLFE